MYRKPPKKSNRIICGLCRRRHGMLFGKIPNESKLRRIEWIKGNKQLQSAPNPADGYLTITLWWMSAKRKRLKALEVSSPCAINNTVTIVKRPALFPIFGHSRQCCTVLYVSDEWKAGLNVDSCVIANGWIGLRLIPSDSNRNATSILLYDALVHLSRVNLSHWCTIGSQCSSHELFPCCFFITDHN